MMQSAGKVYLKHFSFFSRLIVAFLVFKVIRFKVILCNLLQSIWKVKFKVITFNFFY